LTRLELKESLAPVVMSGLRSVLCVGVALIVGCQAIAGVGDKSFGGEHRVSHGDASVDRAEPARETPDVSIGGGSGSGGLAAGGGFSRGSGGDLDTGTGGAVRGGGGSGGTASGGSGANGAAAGRGGATIGRAEAGLDANPDADVEAGAPLYAGVAGVFPNFPILYGGDPNTRQALADLAPNGLHVEIAWGDGFYTSDPSCNPIAGCPPCTDANSCYFRPASDPSCRNSGYDELECYVRGFAFWLSAQALGTSRVSVLVTFDVHAAAWRIGPSHITALQDTPADLGKPQVTASLFAFYDRVSAILADPKYAPYVRDWTISFGNHANDFLCADADAWVEYTKLYRVFRDHALGSARRPEAPVRVGASTAFIGLRCEGLWDLPSNGLSATASRIRDLNGASDVLLLQYFPVDPGNGFLALDPSRVDEDLERMSRFRSSLLDREGGAPPPIVLHEAGYPTDPSLHGQTPSDAGYSQFKSGEEAQGVFMQDLLTASARRSDVFDGLYWWPWIDVPTGPGGICDIYVGAFYVGASTSLKLSLCTSGLSPGLGAPIKPAWNVFRAAAQGRAP
jgi:hypothetical protein